MSINQIACGSDHSIAVSRRHSCIHVWGRNVEGQLGLGDVKDRSTPVRVTFAWWPLPPPGRDLDSLAKSPVDGEEEDGGDEDDEEGGTVVASCGTTHSLLSRLGKKARRGSPPLDLVIPSAHFTKGRLLWRVGQQSLCIIPTVREHQNIKLSSFQPTPPSPNRQIALGPHQPQTAPLHATNAVQASLKPEPLQLPLFKSQNRSLRLRPPSSLWMNSPRKA